MTTASKMPTLQEEFPHDFEELAKDPPIRNAMKHFIRAKVEQCFTMHDVRAVLRDIVDML